MQTLSFKRPLAATGIPFLFGAFLGSVQAIFFAWVAAALAILLFRRRRWLFFCVCVLAGILCTGVYQATRPVDRNALNGQTITVCGTVADTRQASSYTRLTLENARINGENMRATVEVALYFENGIADGDTLELRATCRSDSSAFFDADRYYYERGFDLSVVGTDIIRHETAITRPLSYDAAQNRNALIETIGSLFSAENAAFLQGILLGDNDNLSLETIDVLNRSGARHLFVVSGLHLTLAVGLLYGFLRKLRLPPQICAVAALFAVFGVVWLTGCTVPAMRAAFMTASVYIGHLFFRRTDAANSLFGAAILIVLVAPYSITSASFLLSFSAAAGVYILPPLVLNAISARFPRFNEASSSAKSITATLTGTIAVFPTSAWIIGGVSLLSPVTNLLLSYVLSPILISAVVAFTGIPILAELARFLCEVLLTILRVVVTALSSIPFSYMGTRELFFAVWFILAAGWLIFVWIRKRQFRAVLAHLAAVLLLLPVSLGLMKCAAQPILCATAASSDSADLVLLERNGEADLIVREMRSGWAQNALTFLRSRNITSLRSLVLLTNRSASAHAPAFLTEVFQVETLLLYEENNLVPYTDILLYEETEVVLLPENGRRVLYPGLDIKRQGESITITATHQDSELILSNAIPSPAACWMLFSEEWEDLYLNESQKAVMLTVPDDLEIQGGTLYNAQETAVCAYLHPDGRCVII